MPVLHNRVSQKELKEKLMQEDFKRITISFYKYFQIPEPTAFRDEMYVQFNSLNVFGRIYVAHEGINAQISVPEYHFDIFKTALYSLDKALNNVRLNTAVDDDGKSFWVLKIKVREKIVADGLDDLAFDPSDTGQYLKVEDFNSLSAKEGTIIIDMRNHYEYEVGHFDNAIEIPSDTFKEQLPMAIDMMKDHKDKNIIMYCTGGIRCEKASAYFKHRGFEHVYHLEGGIIEYTNQAKQQNLLNKFKGKNFVFDQRLGEKISDDILAECHQCGSPCDTHTNCKNDGCHLLFIQCDDCRTTYNGCCSTYCHEVSLMSEEEQENLRKGLDKGQMIFNKSRHHRLRPTKEDIQSRLFSIQNK